VLGGLLAVFSFIVYGRGLATQPAAPTEADITTQAARLLEHGWHDAEDRSWPVFVHVDAERWLAPVPVYASAAVMTLMPSTPVPGRWMAVLFGVIDVLLLSVLVARVVPGWWTGFATALVLLATPSHLLFSRTAAPEGIWPLPFVLGWAVGLTALIERPSPRARWMLAAGAAALAASTYTQPSSALMMPMLFVVTAVMFLLAEEWGLRDGIAAAATFAILLVPLLLWFARYPATYPDTFGRWVLHPAHLRNPIVWFQAVANWGTASTVAALFWNFFSPSHLFLTPDAPGLCGLFLTPVVVPIAVGLYHAFQPSHVQQPATRIRSAIVAGCLIGPLAAAMFGHARSDDRALIIVPLGLVVALWGADRLWRQGGRSGRVVLAVTVMATAIQAYFCLA